GDEGLRGDVIVDEVLGHGGGVDEGVDPERVPGPGAGTGADGGDEGPVGGFDGRDDPQLVEVEGRGGADLVHAALVDLAGDLDDRVVGQRGDRAVVRDVQDHPAPFPGEESGHEVDSDLVVAPAQVLLLALMVAGLGPAGRFTFGERGVPECPGQLRVLR